MERKVIKCRTISEIEDLVNRHIDNELSSEEEAEFEQLLEYSKSARELLAETKELLSLANGVKESFKLDETEKAGLRDYLFRETGFDPATGNSFLRVVK